MSATDAARFMMHWRLENEVTQVHMAALMREKGQHWHQATVSKVERGVRELSLDEGLALAEVMGYTVEEMARG